MSCVPCAIVLGLPFVSVKLIVRFACRYRAPERSVHHESYPALSRSAFAALTSNVRFAPGSDGGSYHHCGVIGVMRESPRTTWPPWIGLRMYSWFCALP